MEIAATGDGQNQVADTHAETFLFVISLFLFSMIGAVLLSCAKPGLLYGQTQRVVCHGRLMSSSRPADAILP